MRKTTSESEASIIRTKDIIQPLVGTSKIVLKDIYTDGETNAIVIKARPTKDEQCSCGLYRRKAKYYDKGQEERRWRALDVGSQMTYIEAPVVRVKCKIHGGSHGCCSLGSEDTWFCRSFEDTLAWLTVQTSHSVVSEIMRLDWHTVGGTCKRVYDDLEESSCRFGGLVNIGIDETSYKKGHKYITVVVNHDTNSVGWCSKGFGKTVLTQFFERFIPEQSASIRCVSANGAKWIADSVEKYCPNAQRCRIPVFRKLRLKIKRHFEAIVASATHGLSNARIDATDNKNKLIIGRAYGFRNMDNMIAMVMLSCSSIHPSLPGC